MNEYGYDLSSAISSFNEITWGSPEIYRQNFKMLKEILNC